MIGFLLQPVLGIMSDRCQSSMGRRRPFILALSITSFLGITLILNGIFFGNILGDIDSRVIKYFLHFWTISDK
jgi:solute carrier family 45, member 1/2/4